ncbi:hypothetical protein [Halomonas getboli]|uniref:hypothetical protein n=1 Tax=Halomonas getboli TaxID=2935862 RepID=UPI00200041E3|nr:hypothetical protein [Halomonas getboli]MCK2183542.1 hypothetical protein [Halomonas getboli]
MNHVIPAAALVLPVPVHDLAAAWLQHAERHGAAAPDTELLAVPIIDRNNNPAWRPAIRVPSTRTLLVIHTARPHATEAAATQCLADLLLAMARDGSVRVTQGVAA